MEPAAAFGALHRRRDSHEQTTAVASAAGHWRTMGGAYQGVNGFHPDACLHH